MLPRSTSARHRRSRRASKHPPFRLGRQGSIGQAEAQWFLGLPEKVKSRHFTKEERSILSGRCASVVLDAADNAFYKRSALRGPTAVSPRDRRRSSSSSMEDRTKDKPILNTVSVGDGVEDSLHWLDDDEDFGLRLKLDDYHANMVPDDRIQPLPVDGRSRRPSFRRAALYASRLSGRGWAFSGPPDTRSSKEYHRRSRGRKRSVTGLSGFLTGDAGMDAVPSAVDAGAMYYRDPEARLKLRVYLASPQKLDEAIEFGFPSLPGDSTKVEDERVHTFLDDADDDNATLPFGRDEIHDDDEDDCDDDCDDDTEVDEKEENNNQNLHKDGRTREGEEDEKEEDDDDDEKSIPDMDQPLTPVDIDTTFRSPHRIPYAAKLHSADSTTPRPVGVPRPRRFASYAYAPCMSREMTLRITLTRPDLDPDSERSRRRGGRFSGGGGGGGDDWGNENHNNHHSKKEHGGGFAPSDESMRGMMTWREKNDPLILGDDLFAHNKSHRHHHHKGSGRGNGGAGCGATGRNDGDDLISPSSCPSLPSTGTTTNNHDDEDGQNGLVRKLWKRIVHPGKMI